MNNIQIDNSSMKPREEVEGFIYVQFDNNTKPGQCWHYGRWELQALLDFIYGSTETKVKRIIIKEPHNRNFIQGRAQ